MFGITGMRNVCRCQIWKDSWCHMNLNQWKAYLKTTPSRQNRSQARKQRSLLSTWRQSSPFIGPLRESEQLMLFTPLCEGFSVAPHIAFHVVLALLCTPREYMHERVLLFGKHRLFTLQQWTREWMTGWWQICSMKVDPVEYLLRNYPVRRLNHRVFCFWCWYSWKWCLICCSAGKIHFEFDWKFDRNYWMNEQICGVSILLCC